MAHYRMGMLRKQRGDFAGAEREFQEAIQANTELAPAYNELGLISLAAGDYAKSFDFFANAARVDPTYSAAYYNMAGIRMNTGDYRGAVELYRMYLARAENPGDSLEVITRIRVLLSAGEKKDGDPTR
jgi:tetratricopeptide (TPR) repeat protein